MINKEIAFKALSNFTEGLSSLSSKGAKSGVLKEISGLANPHQLDTTALQYGIQKAAKEFNVNKNVVNDAIDMIGGDEAIDSVRHAWMKQQNPGFKNLSQYKLDEAFTEAFQNPYSNHLLQSKNVSLNNLPDINVADNLAKWSVAHKSSLSL